MPALASSSPLLSTGALMDPIQKCSLYPLCYYSRRFSSSLLSPLYCPQVMSKMLCLSSSLLNPSCSIAGKRTTTMRMLRTTTSVGWEACGIRRRRHMLEDPLGSGMARGVGGGLTSVACLLPFFSLTASRAHLYQPSCGCLLHCSFPAAVRPADLPKRLILIRHGESEANVDRSQYARIPDWRITLTRRGKEQARDCGRRLRRLVKNEPLFIYYSPYKRTRQTLEEVRWSLNPLQIMGEREDERLREQEMGNYQPLPASGEMDRLWNDRNTYGRSYFRFPSGESGLDVMDRVGGFFDALLKEGLNHRWWKNELLLSPGSSPAAPSATSSRTPSTSSSSPLSSRSEEVLVDAATTTMTSATARHGSHQTIPTGPAPPPPSLLTPYVSHGTTSAATSSLFSGSPSPSSQVLPVFFNAAAATSIFGNPTIGHNLEITTTTTSIPVLAGCGDASLFPSSGVSGASSFYSAETRGREKEEASPSSTSSVTTACEASGKEEWVEQEVREDTIVTTTTTVFAAVPRLGAVSVGGTPCVALSSHPVVETSTSCTRNKLPPPGRDPSQTAPASSSMSCGVSSVKRNATEVCTPSHGNAHPVERPLSSTAAPEHPASSTPHAPASTTLTSTGRRVITTPPPTFVDPSHSNTKKHGSTCSSLFPFSLSSPSNVHLYSGIALRKDPPIASPHHALEEDNDDYTVVIVSHGLLIRLFIGRWFRIPTEKIELLQNPPNCSLIVLERAQETTDFRLTEISKALFGSAFKDVL